MRLLDHQLLQHLRPVQLQVVRDVPHAARLQDVRQYVERPVAHDLEERVVDEHGVVREAAADRTVPPRRHRIEQVAELRHDLHEIAVHRQDVAARRRSVAVSQRPPHAVRRRAVHQLHARLLARHLQRHGRRAVRAVVVHDDDLVNVLVVVPHERVHQRTHVHLLVVAGHHDRRRVVKLAVRRQLHARPPRRFLGRFLRPDVQRAAELPHRRSVLQHEADRLHPRHQRPGNTRMHDVVRDHLHVREPLMRRHLHQLELPHRDLALRLSRPATHRRHRVLHEYLRVPVIRLEEEELPARLQQPVDLAQVVRIPVVAQDPRAHHVVEARRRERIQTVAGVDE